jgi:hypothetical protein
LRSLRPDLACLVDKPFCFASNVTHAIREATTGDPTLTQRHRLSARHTFAQRSTSRRSHSRVSRKSCPTGAGLGDNLVSALLACAEYFGDLSQTKCRGLSARERDPLFRAAL